MCHGQLSVMMRSASLIALKIVVISLPAVAAAWVVIWLLLVRQ